MIACQPGQQQAGTSDIAPAPNGIAWPGDYTKWDTISVSHRTDHHSMRTILGNEIAVKAAHSGKTNPWPEGSILAKVVWKESVAEDWNAAIVPSEFIHVEFMEKNTDRFKQTDGWGYSRWLGEELKPYGKDAGFDQECFACHRPVADKDYVFTTPPVMPTGK